jgi:hypothetical protein
MAARKPAQHKVEDAQKEVERLENEEASPSALANPKQPMDPSPSRHWVYAGVVIFGGLILNVILIALLGGSGG